MYQEFHNVWCNCTTRAGETLGGGYRFLSSRKISSAGSLGILLAAIAIFAFPPAEAARPPRRDNQPPSVTITSPLTGGTLKGVISVNVSASDNVGVARVAFLVNNVGLASATSAPYTFSWNSTTVADGPVTLTAVAYDAAGNSRAATVNETVANTSTSDSQPPAINIMSPTVGSTFQGMVAVNVSASDNVGVTRVDFRINGSTLATATTAPYAFSWNSATVPNGSVTLSAVAFDGAGNSSTAVTNGMVANTVTQPPSQPTLSVTSSNPASGVSVRVYPADTAGLSDGTASLTRSYRANIRVWLSAALRSGNNYFIKWQKDGVDFDGAATTSVVMDANHTLTAVYETPSCSGVAVYPGIDSLRNAMAVYPAGSTFCLKAGIHRFTSSVIARNYDQYIGEPGAVLNGSKVVSSFIPVGSYWVASGQTQRQPAMPGTIGGYPTCNANAPGCIYPEKVFFDGQELWQVTTLAALGPGQFYFDYASAQIYLINNPTGHTIEATTGSGGIVGFSTGNNVTVKNLIFEKFGGGDIAGSGNNALKAADNWSVVNNEFRLISGAAVMSAGMSVVRNNNIHHNGEYGIIGRGTFEGNTISYNNIDGFSANYGAGGSKFSAVNGLVVRGNTVANNSGRGLWTDYDNINISYENNIVENNTEMGIFHEVSCATTIKNNVLRGNNTYQGPWVSPWDGGQIFIRGSKDVQIYGNDINAVGPASNAVSLRDDSTSYTAANCGTMQLQNIAVHDNIMRLDRQDFNGIASGTVGYYSTHGLLFSNNTYYLQDLTAGYFWVDGTSPASLTTTQWQAAGQDVTGAFYQY